MQPAPKRDAEGRPKQVRAVASGIPRGVSSRLPACCRVSAAAAAGRFRRGAQRRLAAHSGGSVSRSRLPSARFLDRDSPDNTATFYVGKTDCGQGTGTAFRQMMSDELDIAYDKTSCVMGSTDVTVDQGGSGGSDAIQTDGWPMRRVAAEARRVLLEMASARLRRAGGRARRQQCAAITVKADPSKKRHLRRTDRRQAIQRRAHRRQRRCHHRRGQGQAGAGSQDRRPVAAALRHSRQGGRIVEVGRGREAARHGARAQREAAGRRRNARSIDESSVRGTPGFIKVVSNGNYVAVVCEREEQAIAPPGSSRSNGRSRRRRRSRPLTSCSTTCAARRPLRAQTPRCRATLMRRSPAPRKVIEAEYDMPFQGHTAFGPAHATGRSVERPDDDLLE